MSGHAPWRRVRPDASPEYEARLAKVKADLEAQLAAAGKWMCPHCRDWFDPDDEEGPPPVCYMCRKAGRT